MGTTEGSGNDRSGVECVGQVDLKLEVVVPRVRRWPCKGLLRRPWMEARR
jgi:hypothetical protein